MANSKENHWTELWKKEDWIAVWVGFLIILLILGGLTLKMPSFKWTTDGELATYLSTATPAVEKIGKAAARYAATSTLPDNSENKLPNGWPGLGSSIS
jgi:hypothetical protein